MDIKTTYNIGSIAYFICRSPDRTLYKQCQLCEGKGTLALVRGGVVACSKCTLKNGSTVGTGQIPYSMPGQRFIRMGEVYKVSIEVATEKNVSSYDRERYTKMEDGSYVKVYYQLTNTRFSLNDSNLYPTLDEVRKSLDTGLVLESHEKQLSEDDILL
jgi:DnaJ-class molecular chaperone